MSSLPLSSRSYAVVNRVSSRALVIEPDGARTCFSITEEGVLIDDAPTDDAYTLETDPEISDNLICDFIDDPGPPPYEAVKAHLFEAKRQEDCGLFTILAIDRTKPLPMRQHYAGMAADLIAEESVRSWMRERSVTLLLDPENDVDTVPNEALRTFLQSVRRGPFDAAQVTLLVLAAMRGWLSDAHRALVSDALLEPLRNTALAAEVQSRLRALSPPASVVRAKGLYLPLAKFIIDTFDLPLST